jgi:hypothetical protein
LLHGSGAGDVLLEEEIGKARVHVAIATRMSLADAGGNRTFSIEVACSG